MAQSQGPFARRSTAQTTTIFTVTSPVNLSCVRTTSSRIVGASGLPSLQSRGEAAGACARAGKARRSSLDRDSAGGPGQRRRPHGESRKKMIVVMLNLLWSFRLVQVLLQRLHPVPSLPGFLRNFSPWGSFLRLEQILFQLAHSLLDSPPSWILLEPCFTPRDCCEEFRWGALAAPATACWQSWARRLCIAATCKHLQSHSEASFWYVHSRMTPNARNGKMPR